MKLARRNTLTYPMDEKTAKHRMNFLNFKTSTEDKDKPKKVQKAKVPISEIDKFVL